MRRIQVRAAKIVDNNLRLNPRPRLSKLDPGSAPLGINVVARLFIVLLRKSNTAGRSREATKYLAFR